MSRDPEAEAEQESQKKSHKSPAPNSGGALSSAIGMLVEEEKEKMVEEEELDRIKESIKDSEVPSEARAGTAQRSVRDSQADQ